MPAYDTWVEALIKLNDSYIGAETYKCIDFIPQAYMRTWGDLCSWICFKALGKGRFEGYVTFGARVR